MSAPTVGNSHLAELLFSTNVATLATTCAASHGLAVFFFTNTASTPTTLTDSASNAYTEATGAPFSETGNGLSLTMWWCPSVAGANPTLTFTETGGGNNGVAGWVEVIGANASSFVDAQNAVYSPSTAFPANSAFASCPVTTTVANDLVLAFVGSAVTTARAAGAGYTLVQSESTFRGCEIYSATPGIGATDPSWTGGTANGGCSFTMAIKALGAPAARPSQMFLVSGLLPLAPLGWIIGRRNKLSGVR